MSNVFGEVEDEKAGDEDNADLQGGSSGSRGHACPVGAKQVVQGEAETWQGRVRRQVEFYFSDANLRKDAWMQKKQRDNDGWVLLSELLRFNRLQSMKCRYQAQLVQALRKSEVLVLSVDKTKVRRDFEKVPMENIDPLPNTIYVEGLPLVLGVDDMYRFFNRHGKVCHVELPLQKLTREPLGFCFVEFSKEAEADAAIQSLNGIWPPEWPQRFDGKSLRVMKKAQWQEYRKEYKALGKYSSSASSAASSAAAVVPAPESAAASASNPWVPNVTRGCLVRMSDFSQPQTVISIRQYAEHAVAVEYCDYHPGAQFAYLRLKSSADCSALLEDVRISQRQLGWRMPQVKLLGQEEEQKYWEEVARVRALRAKTASDREAHLKKKKEVEALKASLCASPPSAAAVAAATAAAAAATDVATAAAVASAADAATAAAPDEDGSNVATTTLVSRKGKFLRKMRKLVLNPHGIVRPGDRTLRDSQVRAYTGARPPDPNEDPQAGVASFTDTVCGNPRQMQPGFGRTRGMRNPDGTYSVILKKGARTGPAGAGASEEAREGGAKGTMQVEKVPKGAKRQLSSAQLGDDDELGEHLFEKISGRGFYIPPPSPIAVPVSMVDDDLADPLEPLASGSAAAAAPAKRERPEGESVESKGKKWKGLLVPPESPYNDPFADYVPDDDAATENVGATESQAPGPSAAADAAGAAEEEAPPEAELDDILDLF